MKLILVTVLFGGINGCWLLDPGDFEMDGHNIERQNIGLLPQICIKQPEAPICKFYELPLGNLCLRFHKLAEMAGTTDPKGIFEFLPKTWDTAG